MIMSKNAERDSKIYQMRKETGATLDKIGEKFGLSRERVRQIVCKQNRMLEWRARREEEIKSARPGSFLLVENSRQFTLVLYKLYGEDWGRVLVKDFFKQVNQYDLLVLLRFRRKLFDHACESMSRVVGSDAVWKWRMGKDLSNE